MGQPQQHEQEQVPAPATSAAAGDGRLPEGNAAALAAQLAAGGDSAMRLQQILANLPMVSPHKTTPALPEASASSKVLISCCPGINLCQSLSCMSLVPVGSMHRTSLAPTLHTPYASVTLIVVKGPLSGLVQSC